MNKPLQQQAQEDGVNNQQEFSAWLSGYQRGVDEALKKISKRD